MDQLSSRNAHHEFEHLCRHYSRARICKNILPATGPVSSGGDHGRDFETYRTYLSETLEASSFLGIGDASAIAFACSLQKDDIPSKIRKDLTSIVSYGLPLDAVYFFSSSDLAVSKRHELQKWALETHGITLFVHDGRALAEGLSDRDVFWIAAEFLEVPAEIYPECAETNWYEQLLLKWKKLEPRSSSMADFIEIKDGIRRATFIPEYRKDLDVWKSKMSAFVEQEDCWLFEKATYEIAVAAFRGRGSMRGQEDRLNRYFLHISELYWPNDFEDAVVMLSYCFQALAQGEIGITREELMELKSALEDALEARIDRACNSSTKSGLIEVRGFFELNCCLLGFTGYCIDSAIGFWINMLDAIDESPLFPLDRFADRMTAFNFLIGDSNQYEELTNRIDLELSKRSGGFIAAEKARDRAMQFHERGKILKAISEIQRAQINWFAEETIGNCIRASFHMSKWYQELGLCSAAKYIAMSGCFLATHSTDEDSHELALPLAAQVAMTDFACGSWSAFTRSCEASIKRHFILSSDAGQLEKHPDLQELVFQLATVLAVTERISPENFGALAGEVGKLQLGSVLDIAFFEARNAFCGKNEKEIWSAVAHQLWGIPFSDGGRSRSVAWRALGVSWLVFWKNDFMTMIMGEQFLAALQVIIADLALIELCIVPTSIIVEFDIADCVTASVKQVRSKSGFAWRIEWPREQDPENVDDVIRTVVGTTLTVLSELSLLPYEEFKKIVQERLKNGLMTKVFCVRPFAELLRNWDSEVIFTLALSRFSRVSAPGEFPLREHTELEWNRRPGPTYSREKSLTKISERYELMPLPIRATIKNIRQDSAFQRIVDKLRNEGWRDWQIVAAVLQVAMNHKIPITIGSTVAMTKVQAKQFEWARQPEPLDDPTLPASIFSEEVLRERALGFELASLLGWGLECRMRVPDRASLQRFLKERYGYFSDDVAHRDPFDCNVDPEHLIIDSTDNGSPCDQEKPNTTSR